MRSLISVIASLACAFLHSVAARSEVLMSKSEVIPSEQTAIIQGALEFPRGGGSFPLVILIAPFRRDDAFNAMAMLMLNPKVSKQNMFLMGQSDGAIAAVLSARGRSDRQFRAVAAYYPDCGLLSGTDYIIRSPLIVFVAEKDDWTPPSQCTKAKDTGIVKGAEYELVAYNNAHHSFDQPRSPIK
jgi:hypothetical protein